MVGPRLPDVPDPTKIAGAGAEAVKAIATGGVSVGMGMVEGITKILFQTVGGGAKTIDQAVTNVIDLAMVNIGVGKATGESIRRDLDQACNKVLSQVDQAVGGEIVRKFKSEVEKQLR